MFACVQPKEHIIAGVLIEITPPHPELSKVPRRAKDGPNFSLPCFLSVQSEILIFHWLNISNWP
jgi:hypothetical protein